LLHEARRVVRTYQGKQGTGQIGNKMAYYFAVLADLSNAPPSARYAHGGVPDVIP